MSFPDPSVSEESGQNAFPARRPSFFKTFLPALLALAGGLFLLIARSAPTSLPVTPLGELKAHAGSGTVVRVQARLVSEPEVIGPNGESLALQRAQIELSGDEKTPQIPYDETIPGTVWASDGQNAVAVNPADFDTRFVDAAEAGEVQVEGELPAAVRTALLPDFSDVPAPLHATARIWNIEQSAEVTIVGVVGKENGQPILQAPANGGQFILSPLSPGEITTRIHRAHWLSRAFGWLLFICGALLLFRSFNGLRRGRKRRYGT